jgi:hypothetical protein
MDNNENKENIEDNLDMVNYIMLSRIYDVLVLIANKIVGSDDVAKLVNYHDQGYILGPMPSYKAEEDSSDPAS